MTCVTVACVFVRGHVPFTSEYVLRLRSMVARHLTREHAFICLTDQRHLFVDTGITTVAVPSTPVGVFAWWSKLRLFDPKIELLQSGRCVYVDLDTVVTGDLSELVDYPADFALVPDDAPNFHGKGGRRAVKRFNSSVMVWNGGTQNALFEDFRESYATRLWGDQDWIGERSVTGVTMPLEWFPRLSQSRDGPSATARVVLCKKPKNTEAVKTIPWVREAWQ